LSVRRIYVVRRHQTLPEVIMSGTTDTLDTSPDAEREAVRERVFELDSVVVEYDGRPDRCTVFPTDATRLERMAEWVTADADVCVSLDDAR
jgi:hypothetical protein